MEEGHKFIGWHRPGPFAPWRPLVEGSSYVETLNKLLDAVAAGDKLVLPAGQDPNPPNPPPTIRRGPGS